MKEHTVTFVLPDDTDIPEFVSGCAKLLPLGPIGPVCITGGYTKAYRIEGHLNDA